MTFREIQEKRELETLNRFASFSANTRGRERKEEPCELRTEYQRDRDRIIHSKAFRRLMHKTQVFLAPEGDHYRTRLTHTIEVSQISRTIARGLYLNEDLTEAIALGHDLGHTPFGHNGEKVINEITANGFRHNVHSLRVVDVLEEHAGKRGMNLTLEVRDGILNHSGSLKPMTLEGQIVNKSDRIAYINHDIDDALRSGILTFYDLPKYPIEVLGKTHGERIDFLVNDMIDSSLDKSEISLSKEALDAMTELRSFMFQNVYTSEKVQLASDTKKVRNIIISLYEYYIKNIDELPDDKKANVEEFGIETVVVDHIAGMTDRYAISKYEELFIPKGWKIG